MSPEMRQTVLDGHNGRRSLLARGQVKKNKYCTKTFPPAANMLRMMANAKTPGVGCAVDLCHYDNDKGLNARHKYYAVVCLYTKPHVKLCKPFYEKGRPCSHCPCGTRCQKSTKLCKKIWT
ncbi:hypothetical protein OSTOST_21881 [Ostertagia ostertagi]